MSLRERINGLVLALLVGGSLGWTAGVYGEGSYPADYKPSKLAEKGDTNALARVLAVSTYMTDKLNAAGGNDSPMCYRNCLTVSLNEALKCVDTKSGYTASESCEQDAAQKISACNPKCQ
jgi:hypothetical protein